MDHWIFLEHARKMINEGAKVYEQLLQHKKIKMNKRTPLEVEILIHYYVSSNDYRDLEAPAIKSAIDDFIALGLIQKNPYYRLGSKQAVYIGNNDALKPYIDAICNVPLPTQKWAV